MYWTTVHITEDSSSISVQFLKMYHIDPIHRKRHVIITNVLKRQGKD
uniref:Uncharacterized protein MANES_12G147700 n=1 Tax=Rhizophora mucronata TaxID=61149 RepID=A0A2P2KFV9_RHIMU